MPRVALAAFLLAGTLASVAAAVGAQSKGEWGAKAPALLKRTEVAVAAVRGKVYVVGGFQQGLSFIAPAVEEYDPATDTWRHRASLPSGLHHAGIEARWRQVNDRSEEHTSELQSPCNLVCRLLLEKKKKIMITELFTGKI